MPVARIRDEPPDERLIGSPRLNALGQDSPVFRVFDECARDFNDRIAAARDAIGGLGRFVDQWPWNRISRRDRERGESGAALSPPSRVKDMRREPEYFGELELSLIYVAKKLKHALRLEQLLTDAGLDYAVELDQYSAGTIFPRSRVGAFFYVAPDNDGAARDVVRGGGLAPYEGR